jgi:biopolymer transport protein ExbB
MLLWGCPLSFAQEGARGSRFADPPASTTTDAAADPEIVLAASEVDALTTDVAGDSDDSSDSTATVTRSVLGVLGGAGPMIFPILGCSVVLLMFVFERAINLRRSRVIPKHFVKLFLNEMDEGQLKPEEALELCQENRSPISEVFAAAVKKWNRPSVEIEQAVLDAGEREANGLRRYLRLFNGIATVSPLLGLLGTVLGMIKAFNEIASSDAMGRPELLAEGISQALLTTAGGLSVAIPAFVVYMYFTSRVDRLIMDIDGLGQEVVSAIASDSWKPKPKRKPQANAKAA